MTTLAQPEIRRIDERTFELDSRTRAHEGKKHRIGWALDGELICSCEAAGLGKRDCWAIERVREYLMTTEPKERLLPAVQVLPPPALLPSERTYALIDKAAALALSGAVALPKELNTKDKVAAVMLYGYELGLRPMTALQHLFIVNGRVQPSAQVMAGLLSSRTDAKLSVVESTNALCTLRLTWPSRHLDATWTVRIEEIPQALKSGDVWVKYTRDKLIWHTTKRILRIYAPDIINGLIGPMLDDGAAKTDEDDDFIEGELFNPGDVDLETGEVYEGQVVSHDEHGDRQQVEKAGSAPPIEQSAAGAPPAAPPQHEGRQEQAEAQPRNAAAVGAPGAPAPAPSPDKAPTTVAAYRSYWWAAIEGHGLQRDDVENVSQQQYGNRVPGQLTPVELRDLAKELGVSVALPGQSGIGHVATP